MTLTLVQPAAVEKWNAVYSTGSEKKFPSLDLVRLEKWFFGTKPGKLLEYGFGCGVNLMHLLGCGYEIEALDASIGAKKMVEAKLEGRPQLRSRVNLHHVDTHTKHLPFREGFFDYVVCVSVLSLLGSRERIELLLGEFFRLMKPSAKIILDINGPQSDFAKKGHLRGDGVYIYRDSSNPDTPIECYCPSDALSFAALVGNFFVVDDIGYSAHKYFHSEIQEFIVCAHKERVK